MPTFKFTKKVFHVSYFICFTFIFQERMTITSSKEALKLCDQNLIQEI